MDTTVEDLGILPQIVEHQVEKREDEMDTGLYWYIGSVSKS